MTTRDKWTYTSDKNSLEGNVRRMIEFFNLQIKEGRTSSPDEDLTKIRWTSDLKEVLCKGQFQEFDESKIRVSMYRPFFKQWLYMDSVFNNSVYRMPSYFPELDSENLLICVTGKGETKPFSVLMVDTIPNLHVIAGSQCFPRWVYKTGNRKLVENKIDNVSTETVLRFRNHYNDEDITGDDIFYYVYGVLHSQVYRDRYSANLYRELPRIPMAPDFWAFAEAGKKLGELHLGYENCQQYPLREVFPGKSNPRLDHYRVSKQGMRFASKTDQSVLIVNQHIRLEGIPEEAHEYVVNGRTPLEWMIDRYKISTDGESGIVNDTNNWFEDPKELIASIRRIIYVSLETIKIVRTLPAPSPERDLN